MSGHAKPVAWALLTADGTLALCDRNETYVTLRRERYDEGWPHHAPHTVAPLYAHPPAPVPPVVTEALEYAARVFESYVNLHEAKGTPEASSKAYANAVHASKMRAALTAALRPERGEEA